MLNLYNSLIITKTSLYFYEKKILLIKNSKRSIFFYFEQTAYTTNYIRISKWFFFVFEFFDNYIFDVKNIASIFNLEIKQTIQDIFITSYSKFINLNGEFDIKFVQFISNNKIFLSSNSSADAFFYNELVLKNNFKKEQELIKKYNLPFDFFLNQKVIEKKLHNNFWKSIPYKNEWIYDIDDLYINNPQIPFYTNQNLVDLVNSSMYEYNPIDWYLGWELKYYHHYELFFFLRDLKQQPMFDYWITFFLRYRTSFFEDLIYRDPYWKSHYNENHPFPVFSLWGTEREMKYSYEKYENFFMYLVNSVRLDHHLADGDGLDILWNFFDKNFLYFWNYFKGSELELDFINQYGMITKLQHIQTQICNPLANWPSQYLSFKNPYFSSFERAFYWSIFPETAIPRGRLSLMLDYWTADYNRFFHAGFTFMDGLSLLDIFWYHAAGVVWGGFDAFTEDFLFFQAIYYLEQVNAVRTALIAVLLKEPANKWYFESIISNYDSVFSFRQVPEYWKLLKADLVFNLTRKQWFSIFHDELAPDMKLHQTEWLVCLFFGYNVSLLFNNHPFWYVKMRHSNEMYHILGYDSEDDEEREEFNDWLLWTYSSTYFHNNFNLPKFFKFYPYTDITNYFSYTNIYMRYLNEKFYDDMGFFFTSLMRGEKPFNWKPLLSFNNLFIKYSETIPYFNDVWLQLHSFFKSLNLHIFYRYIGIKMPFYLWTDITKKEIKQWFFETFSFSFKETLVWESFLWHWDVVNYAANCPRYIVFYFSIWLDKILGLFFDLKFFLNSKLFFFLHLFIYSNKSTLEIIYLNEVIDLFQYINNILIKKNISVKIFNEPIQSYFIFLNEFIESKQFKQLWILLIYFIDKLMPVEWMLIGVDKLSTTNYPFKGAALNFLYQGPRTLPLEFYIPFFIRPQSDYVFIENHPTYYPFNINLYDYFNNKNLEYSEYLEKLILIMLINEVVKDNNLSNNFFLHKTLCLLNDLEIDEPKFIGFERYLNYVLKWELYYNNDIPLNQIQLESNKNSQKLLNDIVDIELEFHKKLKINDLEINNFYDKKNFFNLCTEDLKLILIFWEQKFKHDA